MTLLDVKNLTVEFPTPDGLVQAVHETSFQINPGETLAIVGESGSGKTVTNLALMGLIPLRTANVTGSAMFESHDGPVDLLAMDRKDLRKYRGRDMAMIFQDPMSSLHPFYTIGDQIIEAHQVHNQVDEKVSKARAIELLEMVGIQGAANRLKSFPHQFSGGMRQRVMIAMALVNNPALLIADEPTTALDVTVQAQILKLLSDLQKELKMAMILITHDMGVVAGAADRVNVMYAGRIVESANVKDLYANPLMPYTQGLLASVPRMDRPHTDRLSAIPGQPPSMIALPSGCSFNPRCSRKNEVGASKCESQMPDLSSRGNDHFARCFIGEGA
ncbi:DppD ABC-type dipeptide/oligopeptide/nickel transport system, ATPase component [actinobacterium SCGC AAA044-D11]|jgi:peptide/nickel transport system ATP-binding protein